MAYRRTVLFALLAASAVTPILFAQNRQQTPAPQAPPAKAQPFDPHRSEEHTSELQSHSDLHSFPTRRSSDLQEARVRAGAVRTACECLVRKGVSTWRIVARSCSLCWLLRL